MSGVTTTGATIIGSVSTLPNLVDGIESLPKGILFWRSFLQWIGGMGIIVFTIAILPLLGVGGVQLFKAEVPGPVADKIKPELRKQQKFFGWYMLDLPYFKQCFWVLLVCLGLIQFAMHLPQCPLVVLAHKTLVLPHIQVH